MAPETPDETARLRSIQRIAETLGLPVEAFYEDGKTALQVAQTFEMFRLWSALTSGAVREELLERARAGFAAQ